MFYGDKQGYHFLLFPSLGPPLRVMEACAVLWWKSCLRPSFWRDFLHDWPISSSIYNFVGQDLLDLSHGCDIPWSFLSIFLLKWVGYVLHSNGDTTDVLFIFCPADKVIPPHFSDLGWQSQSSVVIWKPLCTLCILNSSFFRPCSLVLIHLPYLLWWRVPLTHSFLGALSGFYLLPCLSWPGFSWIILDPRLSSPSVSLSLSFPRLC